MDPDTRMILQVHDDLVFEIPNDNLDKVIKFLQKEMENAASDLAVKLKVDVDLGNNWGEVKSI